MARQTQKVTEFVREQVEEEETIFSSLDMGYEEEDNLPYEYERIRLTDLEDQETYTGRPVMTEVQSFTIDDDGEEVTKYRCKLYLIDDEEEEMKLALRRMSPHQLEARERLLKDGALIELAGTHYAYLENLDQVTNILYNFF